MEGGSDERDTGLVARVVHLNRLVSEILEGIAGQAGLPMADYLVLAVLRRSPGARSLPSRIAQRLGRTTGGMTPTIDRLEAGGWLRRSGDPQDRRRVVVELTPAGLALAVEVNEALHAWERSLALTHQRRLQVGAAIDDLIDVLVAPPVVVPEPSGRRASPRVGKDHRSA